MSLPIFSILDPSIPVEHQVKDLDITAALQWCLNNKSRDYIILIPPGTARGARPRWQINKTIIFPRQHGGHVWFVGESSNNHATGLHCEIEWAGEKHDLEKQVEERKKNPDFRPGSMFLYSSTDWRFSGSPKFYGGNKCGIGLLTTKDGSYNAGRMNWQNASWKDFTDAGIQIGVRVEENSNECNNWGIQSFSNCGVGVRVVGHQALQQSFDSVFFSGSVGVGFQYFASGCLWVDECYFNGLLLELNAAGRWTPNTDNKSTGKNNGVFYIGRLKSDTQAQAPQLIRCNDAIRADVVFDTGVLSGGDDKKNTVIQVANNCVVTCRNLRMLGGGGTIEGDGGIVILDACSRVSRVGTFADDVRGKLKLIQRDCVNYSGELMAPDPITIDDVCKKIDEMRPPADMSQYMTKQEISKLIEKLSTQFITERRLRELADTVKVTASLEFAE